MRYRIRNPFSQGLEHALAITKEQPAIFRYGIAILSSGLTTFIVLGAQIFVGTTNPYLFLLAPVLLSAWFGGTRPGILAFIYSLIFAGVSYVYPSIGSLDGMFNRAMVQTTLYLLETAIILFLVYKRNKTYIEMQKRTSQQAVIATIGQYGVEERDLTGFMDRVVRAIAKTLDVEFVKILELLPNEKELRIKSGVGWNRGIVGRALVDAGKDSQAGYTLLANRPVIVKDLKKEKRFVGTQLLHDHNVRSGISVVIPGTPRPYGILTVHTRKERNFTKDDVNFVLALANVIAATIERRLNRRELKLMATLNSELVSSLDPQKTLSGVVDTLVPSFADICEVYISQGENQAELVEIKAVSKEKERILKEMGKKYPPVKGSKRPTAMVLRSGKAILNSYLPVTFPHDTGADELHEEMFRQLRLVSNMIVPIKIRNKLIGTIGFGSFERGRIYNERDFQFAKELANRVAVAIDNARLYQEAKNAVQARDEFLSIASHELKTPLTSMLLQLQAVLHSIKNESLASFSIDKTMVMLESTIAQSKRLSRLVSDLLNVSLITTGRLELEREKVDLVKVVEEVCSRLEPQLEKSGSKINIKNEVKSVVGHWDKIRIEQLVINLITNAIKYGEGNPIDVQVSNSNKLATLKVSDHGLGIPKDQQEKIFDRFQRGEVKSSIKGLGVGLYLVNEIIKAHGGKILIESKQKEGSTFTVELPL